MICDHCMGEGVIGGLVVGDRVVDETCPKCGGCGSIGSARARIERELLDREGPERDLDWALAELSATRRKLDTYREALTALANWQSRFADGVVSIARRALGHDA